MVKDFKSLIHECGLVRCNNPHGDLCLKLPEGQMMSPQLVEMVAKLGLLHCQSHKDEEWYLFEIHTFLET